MPEKFDGIRNPYIDVEPFLTDEIKDTGLHFGKGPRGWKLGDDKIYERVCESLYQHHEVDASEIIVTVKDGTVTLSGKVPDRHMKWAAEDSVADVPGVWEINNELEVSERRFHPLKVMNH